MKACRFRNGLACASHLRDYVYDTLYVPHARTCIDLLALPLPSYPHLIWGKHIIFVQHFSFFFRFFSYLCSYSFFLCDWCLFLFEDFSVFQLNTPQRQATTSYSDKTQSSHTHTVIHKEKCMHNGANSRVYTPRKYPQAIFSALNLKVKDALQQRRRGIFAFINRVLAKKSL